MLKRTVSLTLAWMFLVSTISGIMLYIAPPGRIAHWSDWSMLWLTKSQWDSIHTVTTILMLIVVGLHLYYNWKPFTSYMKDKVSKLFTLTKELSISLVITLVVAFGAVYELPPFSLITNFGDYVSEEWEVTYGTPPYNHAELDSVGQFSKKLNIDYTQSKEKLKKANISFDENDTLLDIAKNYKTSPQKIYNIVIDDQVTPVKIKGSGMGKKTLAQVCKIRGLNLDTVLLKLQEQGISATKDDKFKDIAEQNGMNPMNLLEMLQ